MPRMATAIKPQSRRCAVFLGSELRRAETRFWARRNGDSSSTSRSTRRASSSSSRRSDGKFPAYGGYSSSWRMVEPDFRAISSGQLSQESLSLFTIAANLEMRYGKNYRICTGRNLEHQYPVALARTRGSGLVDRGRMQP